VVQWVERTGKKRLVIAGLWTENCLALSALSALSAGYEVYIPFDVCGGNSKESHDMAVQRLIQAGAIPLTSAKLHERTAEGAQAPLRRASVPSAEISTRIWPEGLAVLLRKHFKIRGAAVGSFLPLLGLVILIAVSERVQSMSDVKTQTRIGYPRAIQLCRFGVSPLLLFPLMMAPFVAPATQPEQLKASASRNAR
jgi:Isochorismatase family